MDEIDYKLLLKKYMAFVGHHEGTDFLRHTYEGDGRFTQAEREALQRISRASNVEHNHAQPGTVRAQGHGARFEFVHPTKGTIEFQGTDAIMDIHYEGEKPEPDEELYVGEEGCVTTVPNGQAFATALPDNYGCPACEGPYG